MKVPSYSVEFLPLERRLNERRQLPILARQGRAERRSAQRRSQSDSAGPATHTARAA